MTELDNLHQFLCDAVAEIQAKPITNFTSILESQLDFFHVSVFPVLSSRNIPRYEFLSQVFARAGYDVSAKKIKETMAGIVRKNKRRGIKLTAYVAPSPVVTQTTPQPQMNVAKLPGAVPGRVAPVSKSVLPPPAAVGIEDISWSEEAARLGNEEDSGWNADISSVDTQLVAYFDEIRQRMLLRSLVGSDAVKIQDSFVDTNISACLNLLRRKYDKFGLRLAVM